MNRMICILALIGLVTADCRSTPAPTQTATTTAGPSIIDNVRTAANAGEFALGEQILNDYRTAQGTTPEAIEALSWLARGALGAKAFDQADKFASQTYTLATEALKSRKLEDDAHLQTALGAAIETEALVLVGQGARSEAVALLNRELGTYHDTPIHKRLAKTLDVLTLEGQPPPALVAAEHFEQPVPSFADLKGKVVVLFFWAHWCPDCKIEGPILARLLEKYRSRGLALIAPTQRFGYVAGGRPAPPDVETPYIVDIRDKYYGFLRNEPVPVSDANHKRYGVSTTPTIVIVDREGLVRMYHPGRMTEQELSTEFEKLLGDVN